MQNIHRNEKSSLPVTDDIQGRFYQKKYQKIMIIKKTYRMYSVLQKEVDVLKVYCESIAESRLSIF